MTHTALKTALIVASLLALSACETKVSSPVVRFQRQLSVEAVQAPSSASTEATAAQIQNQASAQPR